MLSLTHCVTVSGTIAEGEFFRTFTKDLCDAVRACPIGASVTLFINSSGGDMATAMGMHDLMATSGRDFTGVVSGVAKGPALMLLQGCKRRIMSKNSMLIYEPMPVVIASGIGEASQTIAFLEDQNGRMLKILLDRLRLEATKAICGAKEPLRFTTVSAVAAGLIDEILE